MTANSMSHQGRSNFLEVSDCFDRRPSSPSRHRPSSLSSAGSSASGANVRRSSSLQFPVQSTHQRRRVETLLPPPSVNFTFLQSAISTIKYSSASIYASTLSAAGLLSGVGLDGLRSPGSLDSTEPINLYSMMATHRCCCGLFRLRTACLFAGILVSGVAIFLLCCLLLHSPFPPSLLLSRWQCRMLCEPAVLLLSLTMLASLLMLLALITDIHFLIMPFMFSCLLNMMGSIAMGLVLLLNPVFPLRTDSKLEQLMPAGLALISTALTCAQLWLLGLSSFTFVLIRDKRSIFRELFIAEMEDNDEEAGHLLLRRSSSAPIEFLNSTTEF